MSGLRIRDAERADVPVIVQFVRELAEFERLTHEVVATEAMFERHLFGSQPLVHALVAELDGEPVGFALYFFTFSTFLGRPGLYLEDLFVRPPARSRGIGRALLAALAQRARVRDCGRMEWSVLDWNVHAMRFYEGIGARCVGEWKLFRMQRDAIDALARG